MEINPFEKRRLCPELAAKYGAYLRRDGFVFEYRSKGRLRYRKLRTWDKKFVVLPSGIPKQLWLLDTIEDLPCRPVLPLVMAEGEFDTLTAITGWGGYAVSVPNGSRSSRTEPGKLIADDTAFSFLWGVDLKLIPELDQFSKIILAMDDDANGQIMRDELAIRIGPGRCWFVTYPEGCKDLNDVLLRYGPERVRQVLEEAKPIRPGHLLKPGAIAPPAFTQTYSSGWKCLDPHLLLARPELVVVTGVPGHGKGVFTRSLCYHLAEQYGLRTAFWTPEDAAHRLRRDMKRFRMRAYPHPTREVQEEAEAWVDDHFMISLLGQDESPTLERIVEEMESAVFHHNCQGFVVDPWNCISHDMGKLTETQYTERALELLKFNMRRLLLMLFLVAHPTKVKKGEQVTLYTINGSANWHNKAEHGIILDRFYNDQKQPLDIIEVNIAKCKDQETMGKPGAVQMKYDPNKADYAYHQAA